MTGPDTHGPTAGGLSNGEMMRYVRHVLLPGVGVAGQQRLKAARVLLVGAGGLGSPAAIYLAAAGVGHITLVDFDRVELSNLQRQPLYGQGDVGRPKVEAAAETLRRINPLVHVEPLDLRLTADNAAEQVVACDLVVDGCDNLATRHAVNRACVALGKPFVYGSIYQFEGQIGVFAIGGAPCYACLFPEAPGAEPPCNCSEAGVLGVLPGIIGALQAAEAIKIIVGIGEPLAGRLLLCDVLGMRFQTLDVPRNPACMVCGPDGVGRVPSARKDKETCASSGASRSISAAALARLLDADTPVIVLDVTDAPGPHPSAPPNSIHIPYHELPARLDELPSGVRIVTVCPLGIRSAVAAALLAQHGFRDAAALEGGYNALATARKAGSC